MPLFGERFVYFPIILTEEQKRVARVRAEAAKRERERAKMFAAGAKKRRLMKDKEKEMKEEETVLVVKDKESSNENDESNQCEKREVENPGNAALERHHHGTDTDVEGNEECHHIFGGTVVRQDEKAGAEDTSPSDDDMPNSQVFIHVPEYVDGFGLQLSLPHHQDGLPLVSVPACEGMDGCEGVHDSGEKILAPHHDTSHNLDHGHPVVSAPVCEDVGEEQEAEIRRSLLVPRRLDAHTGSPLMEDLKARFSVKIFQDCVKGKWHIKGLRRDVLPCYSEVRERIAQWRAENMTP